MAKKNSEENKVICNDHAYGIVYAEGSYLIVKIDFNFEQESMGKVSVQKKIANKYDAQQYFKIMLANDDVV